MIILHAGFLQDRLLLWGESPPEAEKGPAPVRGRRAKTGRPQASPFDAGAARLMSALECMGDSVPSKKMHAETAIAWLPTRGGLPAPSSPLIGETPAPDSAVALSPWSVAVLPLSAERAMPILCMCVGKHTLTPGVVVGRDLAFWVRAMRFAGALVARQQFLPGLESRDGRYRAVWEPVIAGEDRGRLASLSKDMPAVCRALAHEAAPSPPATSPLSLLSTFIGGMVDRLVRVVGPRTPVASAVPRRAGKGAATFASLHDQWLHALRSPDGVMEGDEAELAELAGQIREWRRPISLSVSSPFRLCFRLEEPADDGEERRGRGAASRNGWYVRYLLHPQDDPSLLIPVKDAWAPTGRPHPLLNRRECNAQEYLLSALGQAAGLCPQIERSLETSRPGGYALDAAGAHGFLTERAAALEQAGFGVMLPAWWTRKGTKVRLAVQARVRSPKMQGGGGLSLEEVVHFDWQLALGDAVLTREELEALARLKAPLVRVRGQWVEVKAEEIRAALEFWKKDAGTATVRDVIQMALGATDRARGLDFTGVTATGWVRTLLHQLEGRAAFTEIPAPRQFVGTLRPYQVRGYSWLAFLRDWGLGACLADDMGLGKTVQALALIERDWEANGKHPVLLVCPTSVVNNWQKEAARFTPQLPVMVHHGVGRKRGPAFREDAEKHAIVISTYALLHRDLEHLQGIAWGGVILDEAQNIKNPETKQARAARSLPAGYRAVLTGTPVENNVGDLWSLMEFLNPGLLGTQADFKRRFFVPIQAEQDSEAAGRLKRITGPFILRRLKTDKSIIADLPEKMEMKVFCTLTKEQASLYTAVVREAEGTLNAAEGIQRKGLILATLSKLKQVCNHPAQFLGDNSRIPGRSGKLARLAEMLEEILAVGERALIFSQFAEMGKILQQHLQEAFGREVLFLHGGVPKGQRDRIVERFQDGGAGPPIFVLSLKAGGTGLNLTRASHVFHFDRWWNPAVENQATDRAFRIGQTRNVQVHKYICAGTLEERIDEMIERKKGIAETVIGTGEGWLTELSNRELKQLLALRHEAVEE
ncbi:MAG: DEAD/DEAH box helicase [candidate division NC10 bacterium]|nr:DEAD/DEAH box helicase [candidate division NC10 bacterium]